MPSIVTTTPGDCCCAGGGTGIPCCVNGPLGTPPLIKPTIFLTLLFGNCPELSGVSLKLQYSGGPINGGGFKGWRYLDGAGPGFGADSYVYHISTGPITYAYAVTPTVVACESDCGQNSFYFRGVLVFSKVALNGANAGVVIVCSSTVFMADGQTSCAGFCLPCAAPVNVAGAFVGFDGINCTAPVLTCPEMTFCQPTWRGVYTE